MAVAEASLLVVTESKDFTTWRDVDQLSSLSEDIELLNVFAMFFPSFIIIGQSSKAIIKYKFCLFYFINYHWLCLMGTIVIVTIV